jgi:hypothetical protein
LEAASFSEAKAGFQRQLQKQAADHAEAIMKLQQESFQQQQALRQRLLSRSEHQIQGALQERLAELESERSARLRAEERMEGQGLLQQQLEQRMHAERETLMKGEQAERMRANLKTEELQAELTATQEALVNATTRLGKAEVATEEAEAKAASDAARRVAAEDARARAEQSSAAAVAASTEESERLLEAVMQARAEAGAHADESIGAKQELEIHVERVRNGEAVAEAAARERGKRAMVTFMLAGSRAKCQHYAERCAEAERVAAILVKEVEAEMERGQGRAVEETTALRRVLSEETIELQRAWSVAEGEWRLEYDRAMMQSEERQRQLLAQVEACSRMERAMTIAKEDRDLASERAETAEAAARVAEERIEAELGGLGRERGELRAQQRASASEAEEARAEAKELRRQVRELQAHVDGVTGALANHEATAVPATPGNREDDDSRHGVATGYSSPTRLAEAVARARASAEESGRMLELTRAEQNNLERQLTAERGACDELRRRCEELEHWVESRKVEEDEVRGVRNNEGVTLINNTSPLI